MELTVISQISYNSKLIDALKEQKRGQTPNILQQKTRFNRNNIVFPLTMAVPKSTIQTSQHSQKESLMLSSNHENPQVITIQSSPNRQPPPPMSNANIKDLIYGQEKRRISTATTLKQCLAKGKQHSIHSPSMTLYKKDNLNGHVVSGSSLHVAAN